MGLHENEVTTKMKPETYQETKDRLNKLMDEMVRRMQQGENVSQLEFLYVQDELDRLESELPYFDDEELEAFDAALKEYDGTRSTRPATPNPYSFNEWTDDERDTGADEVSHCEFCYHIRCVCHADI